jgi:hypothetical protein
MHYKLPIQTVNKTLAQQRINDKLRLPTTKKMTFRRLSTQSQKTNGVG